MSELLPPATSKKFWELWRHIHGNGEPGLSGDMRDVKRIIEEMQDVQKEESAENKKLRDEWVAVKHQFEGAKRVLWVIATIIGVAGTVGGATIATLMREILTRLP